MRGKIGSARGIAGIAVGMIVGWLVIVEPAMPQEVGMPAPDVALTDSAGKTVRLADYAGKKSLVLLFMRGFKGPFACYYCTQQTKAYKAAYPQLREAGAEVLLILPGATDAKGYLAKIGAADEEHPDPDFSVPFPVCLDTSFAASKAFHVAFNTAPDLPFPVKEPATIVIGKDGKILFAHHGTAPKERPDVAKVLEVLGKSGGEPEVQPVSAPASKPSLIRWLAFEDGMRRARELGRPVFLEFYADW